MTAISLTEWGRYMDAGETTYAVGRVPAVVTVYLDRAEAEAAADELGGTYVEWTGHTGHQVTTDDLQEDAELESEIEP
jgi:hypothetical protein